MTNQYNLTELLGHSILSKEFVAFAANFKLSKKPELDLDIDNNVYRGGISDKKEGIHLEVRGYRRYHREYGEPEYIKNRKTDELIVKEITIDNLYSEKKVLPKVKLPFDICFGDDKDVVIKKLNKKPYDKSQGSYGYAWWFQFDKFRLLTALNHDYKLIWIRLFRLTTAEMEKVRLKKDLAQQNKNINPANAPAILNYSKKLPTIAWRKRKNKGDEIFTDKAIAEVEKLLNGYLRTLADLAKEKKASSIHSSVKKIVTALNKINDKNDGFIDTMEREELCDFINAVVRKTGLKIEAGIDLTEQWREW